MTTAMNLAHQFVCQTLTFGQGSNVLVNTDNDGTLVFRSYGVPVAKMKDNKLTITTRKYSVTTSKHTSAVRMAAELAGILYDEEDF